MEPAIRGLMVSFGDALRWRFVMGGLGRDLLDDGSGPSRQLGSATTGRLVREWLTAADVSEAPLDPLLWFESPLRSTFPACMAVKAAAEQGTDGGYRYLRRVREGILCERRRLDHAEPLVEEARATGLDVERFRIDLRSHGITEAFAADLDATAALAEKQPADGDARGSRTVAGAVLPTLVISNEAGERRVLVGLHGLAECRTAVEELGTRSRGDRAPTPEGLMEQFGRVTTTEVSQICELPGPRAAAELWRLAGEWKIRARRCLTGELWEKA
jgi:protein-disulfide isomerase-like protein with CxxC motif